jgi:hypothetical protein
MLWKYPSDSWELRNQKFLTDHAGLNDLSAEKAQEIETPFACNHDHNHDCAMLYS